MLKKRVTMRRDFAKDLTLPPDEFLFEWAIGKFFTEFQELELAVCKWLASNLEIEFEKVLILTKDGNFNQKIDMVGNVFARVDGRKKDRQNLLDRMREVNDFRNRLAHGAMFHFENELFLSMPSRDFLDVDEKKRIDNSIVIEKVKKVWDLIGFFVLHSIAGQMKRSADHRQAEQSDV